MVDGEGVLQHLAGQLRDRRRHRRREEERLALRGQVLQDAADVREEAHVEHAVRLVEHEDLEVIELRVREAEVVEQAARASRPGCRRPCGTRAPAVPSRRRRRRRPRTAACGPSSSLACSWICAASSRVGRQDERAGRAALLADQPVQDRKQEGGRLAAAGHGAGEHVAPLHGGRDGVVLDRRRAREAHFLDAAQEIRVKSELRERQENPPGGSNPAGFSWGTEDSPARPTFDAGGPGRPATRGRRLSQKGPKGKSGRGAIIPGRCAERSCWPSAGARGGVSARSRARVRARPGRADEPEPDAPREALVRGRGRQLEARGLRARRVEGRLRRRRALPPGAQGLARADPRRRAEDHDRAAREVGRAVEKGDREGFVRAYDALTDGCNRCHQATNFGFNVVQRPTSNPYSNQSFAPPR